MKVNMTMLITQIIGLFVMFALALFGGAGTIAWPAGWTFLVLFFAFTIALSTWLVKNNPGLMTERMTGVGKSDQKTWDKVFFVLTSIIFYSWLAFMGLDAVRLRWSNVPVWVQAGGTVILLFSFYVFFVTFRENSYLSPAVRVQAEREQTVVSTGPYHYVRHPMYAGFLLYALGTPLLLGSWYGLLFALLLVVGVARRAVMEERTLRAELQGYTEYMGQVKYRFVPGVW
jgi:protein-S-isoprenylcysteine O-methyltransferase Ste14